MDIKQLNEELSKLLEDERPLVPPEILAWGNQYSVNDEFYLYTYIGQDDDKVWFKDRNDEKVAFPKDSEFRRPWSYFSDRQPIEPVPQYMLEPNKAKANNLRREYVQTHGKPYNEGKLREDVIFKDDNITLSDKEIKELERTVAEGTLSGKINGHKWRMEVRFSSGKKLEDVSPAIQRYIYDLVSLNVSHYSFAETIIIVADDYDDYVITKEDLESVTKQLKDTDTENPYITVDVLTRMYWG